MIISFMRMTLIYQTYNWVLQKVPLPFLKRRRQWRADYQKREAAKWDEKNAIEAGSEEEEARIIQKIKVLLEG